MKRFLRKFDMNGSSCSFLMNNEKKMIYWKSGLLFIIFLTGFVLYTVTETMSWTSLLYSYTSYQTNFDPKPKIDLIKYKDFMIAFCNVNNQNASIIDPVINEALNNTLEWRYIAREPWLARGGINIPLKNCTYEMFPKKSVNRRNFLSYKSCYCAEANSLSRYNISYTEKDSFSTFLSYDIKFKDYIYKNQTLYNFYYEYLKTNQIKNYVFFIDTVVDINDYSGNLLSNFLDYQSSFLNADLYANYDIYYSKTYISLSDSPMFSKGKNLFNLEYTEFTGISANKITNYFYFNNNKIANVSNKILTVNFRAANVYFQLFRTNMKIDEFIGKILSYFTLFAMLVIYMSSFINESEKINKNISKIFKGFEINQIMMKKIRIILEDFNEVEYKENPDFNSFNISSNKIFK